MKYYLILIIAIYSDGVSMSSTPFDTHEACQRAGEKMYDRLKDTRGIRFWWQCSPSQ